MVSCVEIDKIAQVLRILFVMIHLKTKFDGNFLFDRKKADSFKSNKFGNLA